MFILDLPYIPHGQSYYEVFYPLVLLTSIYCTLAANMFGLTGHFTQAILLSKMAPGEVGV